MQITGWRSRSRPVLVPPGDASWWSVLATYRIFSRVTHRTEAENLQAQSAQHIALGKSLDLAPDEVAKAVAAGVKILCRDDAGWPVRLSEIYDPPLVLFVRGNTEALTRPGIAIVGTRHPTPYGMGMAERLSCDLASRGLVIFSGMARGVDTFGHKGAIKAKGITVAVFGTGVDVIYPRENKKIAEGILESNGALISEFPLGTFAAPQNFPIATGSSAVSLWACWWWKQESTAAPGLLPVALWNRAAKSSPCRAM